MNLDRARDAVRRRGALIGWSAFGAYAVWFTWQLTSTWADSMRMEDALITLRHARNLVEGNGPVFNLGERVQGFTSPLHTLVSSVAVAVGGESAPTWQNVLGILCLIASAGVAAHMMVRLRAWPAAPLVVALLTVQTLATATWYLIGLETHLFALLFLLATTAHDARRPQATGVASGLLFLTRPEGALMTFLLIGHEWLRTRVLPLRQAATTAAVVVPWLVFATIYYGSPVPATMGAKRGNTSAGDYFLDLGRHYAGVGDEAFGLYPGADLLGSSGWLVPAVLAIAGVVTLLRQRPRMWPLVAFPLTATFGYAVLGVWPGFRWHYYHLNVALSILVALGLHTFLKAALPLVWALARRFATRVGPRETTVAATAAFLTLALALPVFHQTRRQLIHPHVLSERDRTLAALGNWLADRYHPATTVLLDEIGYIGWLSRLRIIDSQGLVTRGLVPGLPRMEMLDRHVPDLLLLHRDAARRHAIHEIQPWMYREMTDFDASPDYRLFSKIDPVNEYLPEHDDNGQLIGFLRRSATGAPAPDDRQEPESDRSPGPPVRLPIVRAVDGIRGHIDSIEPVPGATGPEGEHFRLSGWALDPTDPEAVREVVVLLNGELIGQSPVALPRRPNIAATFGREFEYSGFVLPATADPERLEATGVAAYAITDDAAVRLRSRFLPLSPAAEEPGVLSTTDGRHLTIQPPQGPFQGELERVGRHNGRTIVEGWAADTELGQRPRHLVIYRRGTFLRVFDAHRSRPDVAQRFQDPRLEVTGFRTAVPDAPDPEGFGQEHRVFALFDRGVAVELQLPDRSNAGLRKLSRGAAGEMQAVIRRSPSAQGDGDRWLLVGHDETTADLTWPEPEAGDRTVSPTAR